MLKKIGLGVLSVILAIVVIAAFKPADYLVSREITVNASAAKIFPYLNNAKLNAQWSPWQELDPQAKMEVSGPDAGVGAKTSWTAGEKLGTGSATVVESVENQRVGIKLEYVKPYVMVQDAEYAVKQVSDTQSVVTWSVKGKNNLAGRIMCMFMNMDKMVGGMFEKGLSNLKVLVEKQ